MLLGFLRDIRVLDRGWLSIFQNLVWIPIRLDHVHKGEMWSSGNWGVSQYWTHAFLCFISQFGCGYVLEEDVF